MNNFINITDGESTTTSLAIAQGVEMEHSSVIKTIRKNIDDLESFGPVDFKTIQFESDGVMRSKKVAILNQYQSTLLLSYMRNSSIVKAFKVRLVKEFFDMTDRIQKQKESQLLSHPSDYSCGAEMSPAQRAESVKASMLRIAEIMKVPSHYALQVSADINAQELEA